MDFKQQITHNTACMQERYSGPAMQGELGSRPVASISLTGVQFDLVGDQYSRVWDLLSSNWLKLEISHYNGMSMSMFMIPKMII